MIMPPPLLLFCLVTAAWLAPTSHAHCDNLEPVGDASEFRFDDATSPDYDSVGDYEDFDFEYFGPDHKDIKVFQDDDSYAGSDLQDCSTAYPDYYDYWDDKGRIYVTRVIDGDEEIRDYDCKTSKNEDDDDWKAALEEAIKNDISPEMLFEFPPSSENDDCCESFRYKIDEMLGPVEFTLDGGEDSLKVKVELTLTSVFDNSEDDANRFAELCEEMFICDQYLKFSDRELCEAQGGGKRCPSYTQRSLCFNDFYKTGNQDGERDFRYGYIIGACWGVGDLEAFFDETNSKDGETYTDLFPLDGSSASSILEDLVDRVAGTCAAATDRSNRALFVPTDACDELVECYIGTVPDAETDFSVDDDAKFDICEDDTDEELATRLTDCETGSDPPESYSFTAQCPGYLQEFFQSFPPDYPYGDSNNDYKSYILDFIDAKDTGDSRSDGGTLGTLAIFRVALAAIDVVAQGIRDTFPEDFVYTWKTVPWLLSSVPLLALDLIIEKYDFHDGNVDGAEIEAFYENSRQLLDGSAALFDEVRCRQPLDEVGAFRYLWGQGCNSIDDNCLRDVDECDEDMIDPVIDTSVVYERCSGQWFNSFAEAKACIDSAVNAEDDCYTVTLSSVHQSGTSCENTVFEVTASTGEPCPQSTVVSVESVDVDTVAPEVSCQLLEGTKDLLWLDNGDLSPAANFGAKLANVGLVLIVGSTAPGDCSSNSVNVTIKVFSNEAETAPKGGNVEFYEFDKSAVFALNSADLYGAPEALYLPIDNCMSNNTKTCIRDPDLLGADVDARLYTIRVEAVDEAGNAAEDTCRILIPADPDGSITFADVAISSQRFSIGEFKFKLEPTSSP